MIENMKFILTFSLSRLHAMTRDGNLDLLTKKTNSLLHPPHDKADSKRGLEKKIEVIFKLNNFFQTYLFYIIRILFKFASSSLKNEKKNC